MNQVTVTFVCYCVPREEKKPMKDELFTELVESVRQAKAMMRGELEPSRQFVFEPLDVKQIRANLGLKHDHKRDHVRLKRDHDHV